MAKSKEGLRSRQAKSQTSKKKDDTDKQSTNKPESEEAKLQRWYPQWRLYHTYGAALTSIGVALASTFGKIFDTVITSDAEMALLIICVGLLGIPHGASDHVVIADTLHSYFRAWWLPAFLVVYLGLVALVLLFWHLAPVTALLSFIAISAIHFGLGDVDSALSGSLYFLEVPTRGFMIMVLPCVHHTHNVDRIWTWLVGNEEQNRSVQKALEWMHFLMPIWYICICSIMIYHQFKFVNSLQKQPKTPPRTSKTEADASEANADTKREQKQPLSKMLCLDHLDSEENTSGMFRWTGKSMKHQSIVIELFSIYALFASTTPIVAFIVYFCIWHSARHNFMVAATCFDRSDGFRALTRFFWASVPFSLGALAMGYAGFQYMHDKPENLIKVQLRMVFIGLNALTIPHMMFIEMSDLRGRVASGQCANFIGLVMGTNVAAQKHGHTGKKLESSPRLP